MSKLVPAHDISNCYQCIEYKSMPGTDDQLMYCRKIKRKTNSSSIINNESISSNTITQFDEKWLDLISIPDKKSVYDYINVNHRLKFYRDWETDRKSTRLNSSHSGESRMPSSA